ncbi:MAG: hypothetical protein WA954_05840 [Parerythrobacter sp.]
MPPKVGERSGFDLFRRNWHSKPGWNSEAIVHLNRYVSYAAGDALAPFVPAEMLRADGGPAKA